EGERLVAAERKALLQVAVGASLFLMVAFWILLDRILVRRVNRLDEAMRAVSEGKREVAMLAEGSDELANLGKGFNLMLAQVRASDAEKNRSLEEARRDLASKERLATM